MEYKKRWIYKLCQYSWLILLPILIVLWILVWLLPGIAPQFVEMAIVASAISVIGLAAVTYLYSIHTRELIETAREQTVASSRVAEASEKSTMQAYEQAIQMLRPIVIPEITPAGGVDWKSWNGNLTVRNGGNGPAIQLQIKILVGEAAVPWQRELPVLLAGQVQQFDVALNFPPQLGEIANGNGTKLEYMLQIDWGAPYEESRSGCILPFVIKIDPHGKSSVSVDILSFEWPSFTRVHRG
ncbi:MAG: hypothetical protein JW856_05105 [Dehalococcoidales bacterium]|nr:hypothetical protein [Dehalococcoidales bacterium]